MSGPVANHRQAAIQQRATYDDLPVPLGKYAEVYAARQRKLNAHVALSIVLLFGFMYAVSSLLDNLMNINMWCKHSTL